MTDPWHFLDAVYCITLDTATHRHPKVQAELERVGLWPKTTMLFNQRDPQGGLRGCHESHRKAWALAKERRLRNVLILEDDVFFAKDMNKYLPYAAAFVNGAKDWDCLFLGWTPIRSKSTKWKHIAEIRCGTAMHAYIVNRGALEKGLPPFDQHKLPVDILIMCPQCGTKSHTTPLQQCVRRPNPAYQMFTLNPVVAFQKYDKTTATGNSDAANKRKQKVRLMRFFGSTSTTTDTPTVVLLFGLVGIVLALGLVATAITVPIVVTKKKKAATLQGGGWSRGTQGAMVAALVTGLVLTAAVVLMCGTTAYQGNTLFIRETSRASLTEPSSSKF